MKKIAVLIIFCLMLVCSGLAQDKSEPAPIVSLMDMNGKTVKLSDFKGKVVLLNFWAVWCVPCAAEISELVKWQREYQSNGLQIIGVTYPPTSKFKVRSFARKMKINYPVLFGSKKTKELFDPDENLPYSVIIDQKGNIKERIEGVIFADEFDEKVKPLLELNSKQRSYLPGK